MFRCSLDAATIEGLRADYLEGFGPSQAAERNGVSPSTTPKYWRRFKADGLRPGPKQPRKRGFRPLPLNSRSRIRYRGPVWIGKSITPQPRPIGKQWIGHRLTN